jgi:hypothetical protein
MYFQYSRIASQREVKKHFWLLFLCKKQLISSTRTKHLNHISYYIFMPQMVANMKYEVKIAQRLTRLSPFGILYE